MSIFGTENYIIILNDLDVFILLKQQLRSAIFSRQPIKKVPIPSHCGTAELIRVEKNQR